MSTIKLTNQYHAVSTDKPKWEKTPDGFLRCRARVLAERIMPYGKDELGDSEVVNAIEGDHVQMFVSRDVMNVADSLRSLEGCPCTIDDHQWLDTDNVKEFSIGHAAGTPVVDGPYVVVDLFITDLDAIRKIEESECQEISAAYTAETIFEDGEHDGMPYHARQTQLRYNHIAIIPAGHGRAGQDVRIINKSKGEGTMSEKNVVRVRLRNTGRFVNMDESEATALENEMQAAEDEKSQLTAENEEGAKKIDELMNELEEKNGELSTAQSEVEELKGELSVYKEKIDELLDGAIEEAAEAMIEEQGEASEILENAIDEEDEKAEEIMNSIKGLRGAKLHAQVLNSIGVKTDGMSNDALKGAFKAQLQLTNSAKARGKKTVAGHKVLNSGSKAVSHPNGRDARSRLGFKSE